MYALTGAHRTLPMNVLVKVTNLRTHKSVIIRINDRGPWIKSRVLDLSYTASRRIGMTGVDYVEYYMVSRAPICTIDSSRSIK